MSDQLSDAVCVPGKVIFTGEHAVLHNKLAVACTINRYTSVAITAPYLSNNVIHISVFDANDIILYKETYDKLGLAKTDTLLTYCIRQWLQFFNIPVTYNFDLNIKSNILLKSGMGSSSALIIAIGKCLAEYYKVKISKAQFLAKAIEIENFQHGTSSGFDLKTIMHGGFYAGDEIELKTEFHPQFPLYIVDTGQAMSSTAESVLMASQYFNNSLVNEFSSVFYKVVQALQNKQWSLIQECIAHNHFLLTKLSIVPQKVQSFINKVMSHGAAAKVCGAGSAIGDNAGILLICGSVDLNDICPEYNFNFWPLEIQSQGVNFV